MPNPLESCEVSCPYCGEMLICQIDTSVEQQQYIEDCHVCCAPIVFHVHVEVGAARLEVQARRDDE